MYKPTEDVVKRLPKTDLHVHIDGSLRIPTIFELAEKQKIKLPAKNEDQLRRVLKIGKKCKDLNEYLKGFEITLSILQTEDALYRVVYELAEDSAKENIVYIEPRYSPILHTKKGLKLTTVVEIVLEALENAKKDFGIQSGLIISGIRNIDPKMSLRLAELSVAYKNKGVVGFDLAGAEYDFPAKHHKEAFFLIRSNNVNCTAHAGEAYGPESIHQALHYCGAHRIGHGTRLREDGDLLNYINDHRIPIEICFSSNILTCAVEDFSSHPLRFYYDIGLRITLNTDNRLFADTTLTNEFMLAAKYFNFNLVDFREIIINSFKSAFVDYRRRQEMLQKAIKEIDSIIEECIAKEGIKKESLELPKTTSRALLEIEPFPSPSNLEKNAVEKII